MRRVDEGGWMRMVVRMDDEEREKAHIGARTAHGRIMSCHATSRSRVVVTREREREKRRGRWRGIDKVSTE